MGILYVNCYWDSLFTLLKKLLGVKQTTQNDFINRELERLNYQSQRYINIINYLYWLKVIHCQDRIYIKSIYNMMLNDLEVKPYKKLGNAC